ncbi:DUF2062 domain-containing protein [bacterium]|nr:DUF2062 domain-containing protein [bacterium]
MSESIPVPRKTQSFKEKLFFIVSLKGSPERLALSFSIGIFLGFSPLYGIHTFFALLLVYLLRLNLSTMMLGAWLNFPIIAPAVYLFCYQLGRFFSFSTEPIPYELLMDSINKLVHMEFSKILIGSNDLYLIVTHLFLGTTIVGLVMAAAGYYGLKHLIILHRKSKKNMTD